MYHFFLAALRIGLRSRAFQGTVIVGLLLITFGLAGSQFSPRQPVTVGVSLIISAVHLLGILAALFWVHELYTKELDTGSLRTSLSFPLPRSHFLLGRFLGICALLGIALSTYAFLLWIGTLGMEAIYRTPASNPSLGPTIPVVFFFIWLEVIVVAAFSWFIASLSTTVMLPFLLGLAFAVSGRTIGPALEYLKAGKGTASRLQDTFLPTLDKILWLLPDLSRLDLRRWALYGEAPEVLSLGLTALNPLGYTAILLGLSIWFFNRRDLG